jgi:hypothetical protein
MIASGCTKMVADWRVHLRPLTGGLRSRRSTAEGGHRERRGGHPITTCALLLLSLAVAPPALGQDAAAIPVAAEVVDVPMLRQPGWLRELPAWLDRVETGGSGRQRGDRVMVGGGLAALVAETIEPDRARVRLEYIAN